MKFLLAVLVSVLAIGVAIADYSPSQRGCFDPESLGCSSR